MKPEDLAAMRAAVDQLIARNLGIDLARACSGDVTEAQCAAAIARFEMAARDVSGGSKSGPPETTPIAGRLQ
jgi:hypothetical protein